MKLTGNRSNHCGIRPLCETAVYPISRTVAPHFKGNGLFIYFVIYVIIIFMFTASLVFLFGITYSVFDSNR